MSKISFKFPRGQWVKTGSSDDSLPDGSGAKPLPELRVMIHVLIRSSDIHLREFCKEMLQEEAPSITWTNVDNWHNNNRALWNTSESNFSLRTQDINKINGFENYLLCVVQVQNLMVQLEARENELSQVKDSLHDANLQKYAVSWLWNECNEWVEPSQL